MGDSDRINQQTYEVATPACHMLHLLLVRFQDFGEWQSLSVVVPASG